MQQSNTIFAYLLIAFVVFITMRGELPKYLGFLLAGHSAEEATAGALPSAVASISPQQAAGIVQTAEDHAGSRTTDNVNAVSGLVANVAKLVAMLG